MSAPLTRHEVCSALLGRAARRPAFIPLGHGPAARAAQVAPARLGEDPGLLANALDSAQRLFGYDAIVVGFDHAARADVVTEAVRRVRATRADVAVVGVVPAPTPPATRADAVALARELGEAGVDALLVHHWSTDSHDPAVLRTLSRVAAHYRAVLVRSVDAADPLDRTTVDGPLAPGRPLTEHEDAKAHPAVARVVDLTGPIRPAPAAWLTTCPHEADTTPESLHAAVAAIGR